MRTTLYDREEYYPIHIPRYLADGTVLCSMEVCSVWSVHCRTAVLFYACGLQVISVMDCPACIGKGIHYRRFEAGLGQVLAPTLASSGSAFQRIKGVVFTGITVRPEQHRAVQEWRAAVASSKANAAQ